MTDIVTGDWLSDQMKHDNEAREAEEQAREQLPLIRKHLESLGWTLDFVMGGRGVPDGYLDKHNDYRVSLSGDNGYLWTLTRFSDSDNSEGIATAKWKDVEDEHRGTVEGDTLASLLRALRFIETGKWPIDWHEEPKPEWTAADQADAELHAMRDEDEGETF